ncbi:alpha/beta hydrolase [Streptomyces sp. NPDC048637]|uniref:alpha/beta fold hydrolase n=1 Tax=Streptomyces sp. NPDC048637 TaxID=3155636 RepID=UPI00341C3141
MSAHPVVMPGSAPSRAVRQKAARPLPDSAVGFYVESLAREPEALRASFEYYRATDDNSAQNHRRKLHPLTLPVLSVAGAHGQGQRLAGLLDPVTERLDSAVLPDCGHYVPEEQPNALLEHPSLSFTTGFGHHWLRPPMTSPTTDLA